MRSLELAWDFHLLHNSMILSAALLKLGSTLTSSALQRTNITELPTSNCDRTAPRHGQRYYSQPFDSRIPNVSFPTLRHFETFGLERPIASKSQDHYDITMRLLCSFGCPGGGGGSLGFFRVSEVEAIELPSLEEW